MLNTNKYIAAINAASIAIAFTITIIIEKYMFQQIQLTLEKHLIKSNNYSLVVLV